jgi:hypothetical protein
MVLSHTLAEVTIDLASVGLGGGSIAWVDAGGITTCRSGERWQACRDGHEHAFTVSFDPWSLDLRQARVVPASEVGCR